MMLNLGTNHGTHQRAMLMVCQVTSDCADGRTLQNAVMLVMNGHRLLRLLLR